MSAAARWCAAGTVALRLTLGLTLATGGCYLQTQRFPGPMEALADPLPPGTLNEYPPGPEEVLVVRHADPVQVRPAGQAAPHPLPFYNKQARVNAGSWVYSGAGGRVEVLWPSGSSIVLYGRSTGAVGSSSRGDPLFFFREIERAQLNLTEGDRVELLGGAILLAEAGPFVIEHPSSEILRIRNRSKRPGRVAFRTAIFDIDPGEVLDLPLLGAGGEPRPADPSFQTIDLGGWTMDVRGDVEVDRVPGGGRARAGGEQEIRAAGVRVRLDPGEAALFTDLASHPAASAPAPAATVEPEPERTEAPLVQDSRL